MKKKSKKKTSTRASSSRSERTRRSSSSPVRKTSRKTGRTTKAGKSARKRPAAGKRPAARKAPVKKRTVAPKKRPAKKTKPAALSPARSNSRPAAARRKAKTPFSKRELSQFRDKLLERRRRILKSVLAMEAEALKASDQDFSVDHMADHGSDNFEQDFTLSLVENVRRELGDIDRALDRIEQGTYGICEGTGRPIGRNRLEAIPYARYSIEYQRRLESGESVEEEDEEPPALGVPAGEDTASDPPEEDEE
ncbi:MAG: TraR/DksA C4-type zinc finger protein [Planctomycetota bacterium]